MQQWKLEQVPAHQGQVYLSWTLDNRERAFGVT